MRPYALILRKRDGGEIPPADLRRFLRGYQEGEVPDYQVAAFLMAVFYRGLTGAELGALVEEILTSGRRVDFGGAPGRRVDKHSTGGVGDKVSLILAPLVASLGVQVPMMSGRGLGHSGGTVDKLESIPGFRMDLDLDRFRAQVLDLGTALISQTPEIAPLDGRLYALRDVTATVESVPLIAASIMSKKIAEGIDGLVLDVKTGNGAFLPEEARAVELARTMIGIGADHGREVVALITAMDRPLGVAVGNSLELVEAIETLRGGGPPDVREVTLALAAEMLVMGGVAGDRDEARRQAEAALDDGRGLARLREVVAAQGGDPSVIDDPGALPGAPVVLEVGARTAGRVLSMDTRAIGAAAVDLGAGRASLGDPIDHRVGFMIRVKPGDDVGRGGPLAVIHAGDDASAARASEVILRAIRIGAGEADPRPLVSHRVTAGGVEALG